MKKYFILSLAVLILAMVSGCGTIYSAAVDQRNVKTIANDTAIKTKIVKQFIDDDTVKILDISTSCYQGHVYLVGEYVTKRQKNRVIEIAKRTEGVREVTTYLLPKKREDLCGTSDNLGIMAKVKTKLVGDKEIW
jgi:hyperosmotically inducible protein